MDVLGGGRGGTCASPLSSRSTGGGGGLKLGGPVSLRGRGGVFVDTICKSADSTSATKCLLGGRGGVDCSGCKSRFPVGTTEGWLGETAATTVSSDTSTEWLSIPLGGRAGIELDWGGSSSSFGGRVGTEG